MDPSVHECPPFQEFQKIARLSRDVVITEKIDGTNAQIVISDDGSGIWAANRTRYITPENDNFGFASWVQEHRDELLTLGPGRHYGEWWGQGIQRRYNQDRKRFSLFNTIRWTETPPPACCELVPVIYQGLFSFEAIGYALDWLRNKGSLAAPGFMNPEGIVIYHIQGRIIFKKTLEKDELPKGATQ